MKGFLSLLAVALIAVFCGVIFLTFHSESFGNWESQQRLHAYSETRNNTVPDQQGMQTAAIEAPVGQFAAAYTASIRSCPAP